MLAVEEARARIAGRVKTLGTEVAPIAGAHGRVLATAAVARRSLPPRDNSAMDGFAIVAADVPATLPIAAESAAGVDPVPPHTAGTATRIMTGAPMPAGADTVVIREDVVEAADGSSARFDEAASAGDNIRRAGEDIAAGAVAIEAGTRLGAPEIGLLAALGYPTPEVFRRPRVAILSTGDELIDVTEDPPPGRIINSNAYALAAAVRDAGGIPFIAGIVGDREPEVVDALAAVLRDTDVLLTSGGVSVGKYDFVKPALAANGVETDFWKVAVKPGKPLVFGVAPGGALVFGLPGNPVSSLVSFELFVRPALLAMGGGSRERAPAHRRRPRERLPEVGRPRALPASDAGADGHRARRPPDEAAGLGHDHLDGRRRRARRNSRRCHRGRRRRDGQRDLALAPMKHVATTAGRADAIVADAFPGTSRRRVAALFADKQVRINGRLARKGDSVAPGDTIEVAREPETDEDRRPRPEPMDGVEVVFEDDDLVAINKPAALATHPVAAGEMGTAANWLVDRYPESDGVGDDSREAGWVHRLDRGTSGVLLAARSRRAWLEARELFRGHRVEKIYHL